MLRIADSMKDRLHAKPAPSPLIFVGVCTVRKIMSASGTSAPRSALNRRLLALRKISGNPGSSKGASRF